MIVIVDYGAGNLRSIQYKLDISNVNVTSSNDYQIIESANKLILAGVGNFKTAMENLEDLGLSDLIIKKVKVDKIPIFGICLGMQLFAEYSEEGDSQGLGLIKGKVKKFNFNDSNNLKIPHVGWNTVSIKKSNKILTNISEGQSFYFTHSYHLTCDDNIILTKTNYGYDFVSSIKHENILGTQFHPEKSYRSGFKLLLDFCKNA